jgi:hypothetical protein
MTTDELTNMSLRMNVVWLVARDLSPLVNHDDDCVNLVVEDVLRRWQTVDPDQRQAQPGGLDGFWDRYADQVEYGRPDSGDQYRAEFCPPDPESFDLDAYYAAVWRAHATDLRRKATLSA